MSLSADDETVCRCMMTCVGMRGGECVGTGLYVWAIRVVN